MSNSFAFGMNFLTISLGSSPIYFANSSLFIITSYFLKAASQARAKVAPLSMSVPSRSNATPLIIWPSALLWLLNDALNHFITCLTISKKVIIRGT